MTTRKVQAKYVAFAAVTYLLGYTGVYASLASFATCNKGNIVDQIVCRAQNTIARGIDAFISVFVGGILGIVNTIFTGLQDGVAKLIDFLTLIPRKFIGLIGTLFQGVTNALENVLGITVTRPPVGMATSYPGTTGPFQIPGIGWAIIGMIIIGGGLAMYQMSDDIAGYLGGFGQMWTGFSVILMTIGGMLGLWGMFPQYGLYIIAFGFAAIVLTAAWTVRGIIIEETGP